MVQILKKVCFAKLITEEAGFIQSTIAPGAYEIENLNDGIEGTIFDEGYYTRSKYPFTIKPIFS